MFNETSMPQSWDIFVSHTIPKKALYLIIPLKLVNICNSDRLVQQKAESPAN